MKKLIFIIIFLFPLFVFSQSRMKQDSLPPSKMKIYYLVLLKKGENRTQDSATAMQIQKGHIANIGRLAELGVIHLAGPIAKDGDIRGIFVMNTKDEEEAKKHLETDPAISSGRLKYEILPWMSEPGNCIR